MNANGTGQTRITNNTASDGSPVWSPSGTRIAFQSNRTGNYDIFTMNVDGSAQTNRTNNPAVDEYPEWNPNGTEILFDSNRTDGNFEGFDILPDGTQPRILQAPGNDVALALADGELAYVRDVDGDLDIWTIEGDLTQNSAADEFPDWQPIIRNYARPAGATPLSVPLVPAYKQCQFGSTNHRGALSTNSCWGPKAESSYLTVGTPDFNGKPSVSNGRLRIDVICNGGVAGEQPPCLTTTGDQLDGRIGVSITDVRCSGSTGGCFGGAALEDYTGNLRAQMHFRITDKNNGPLDSGPAAAGTVEDVTLGFNVPCAQTAATTVGATCAVTTTIDSVLGGNTVIAEQKRAIWQLGGTAGVIQLFDGGVDGNVATTSGDTLFATGGLFFP
jgi:hypothetical protein